MIEVMIFKVISYNDKKLQCHIGIIKEIVLFCRTKGKAEANDFKSLGANIWAWIKIIARWGYELSI